MNNPSHRKRHPENRNLKLHRSSTFHGLPVQQDAGPLIENYLQRIEDVLRTFLTGYRCVTALRFDLRLPQWMQPPEGEKLITNFWERLKDRIEADRARAKRHNPHAHDTEVGYVWTREFDEAGNRPHWHCVLLVNKDAYYGIGRLWSDRENMHQRVASAWSSALRQEPEQVQGLVQIPRNPVYHVFRDSEGLDFEALFYRLSYFAKMKTKLYHGSAHAFGSSSVVLAQAQPCQH